MTRTRRPSGAESRAQFLDLFDAIEQAHLIALQALAEYPATDVLARHLEIISGQLSALEARLALCSAESRLRA